ncbi:MAG: GNAT family N-acetyltransferase [Chloroflexota bacterium]
MIGNELEYRQNLDGVDWVALKERLRLDRFDNGRTPMQYQLSFENSFAVVLAWDRGEIVGKARALSDGVCNGYIVDVWTYSPYRQRGIATAMMTILKEKLTGQHIYLFTDDAAPFYKKLGFEPQGEGMALVYGTWLQNESLA